MNSRLYMGAILLLLVSVLIGQQASVSTLEHPPNPDHIYVATIGMPETVDPHWAYDTVSGEIIQNIYEPLCMFDGMETGKFVGGVADSWPGYGTPGSIIVPSPPDPAAPAGTDETWYFHIRTGNPWQDPAYGVVTPADVEYSFERGMLFDHTNGPMWMLYEPLLGGASSYDYDTYPDGDINARVSGIVFGRDKRDTVQRHTCVVQPRRGLRAVPADPEPNMVNDHLQTMEH